jgi:dipeptidyl-peptidase-4
MEDSFPAEYAQTLNYTLGSARTFRISRDGRRVFYLRSRGPTERELDLWCLQLGTSQFGSSESLVIDAKDLLTGEGGAKTSETERFRRERVREASSGITDYVIDDLGATVAFSLNGVVYVKRIDDLSPLRLSSEEASFVDLSPDGGMVSYVARRELYVTKVGSAGVVGRPVRVSPQATETIGWGFPEFIATEEMGRHKGHWWSPDGKSLLFAKVDETLVQVWYLSDPADPASRPRAIRYPVAGTANAEVSIFVWREDGSLIEIEWDKDRFPYLAAVRWRQAEPTLIVQDRRQRELTVVSADPATGKTVRLYTRKDPAWVDLTTDLPTWSRTGEVVDISSPETSELCLAGRRISKAGLETRKFVGETTSAKFIYLGSDHPTSVQVWASDGVTNTQLSRGEGIFDAAVAGETVVVFGETMETPPLHAEVIDVASGARTTIANNAMNPSISSRPRFCRSDVRGINYAVLLPREVPDNQKLPILVDSYGGPMVQRCRNSTLLFTTSQWFANQGFAVIVADGRGSPGRGRAWETAITDNLIGPVLEDQIEALDHVIATNAYVDPTRVAIRGWSFGGYLAAMAVLKRPDKFHAAISGAPVTDWRYYDTHYTERYLGLPQKNGAAFDFCSAVLAASHLTRPLLLIHGLSDDNVVSAHTLRMSRGLFEAERPHNVLPLTGVTHMIASDPAANAHLLAAQLLFLVEELKLD